MIKLNALLLLHHCQAAILDGYFFSGPSTPNPGASSPPPCPDGFYCVNGSSALACPVGFICPAGSSAPQPVTTTSGQPTTSTAQQTTSAAQATAQIITTSTAQPTTTACPGGAYPATSGVTKKFANAFIGDNGQIQTPQNGAFCADFYAGYDIKEFQYRENFYDLGCYNTYYWSVYYPVPSCPWKQGVDCYSSFVKNVAYSENDDYIMALYCRAGCVQKSSCIPVQNAKFTAIGTVQQGCPFECNAGYSLDTKSNTCAPISSGSVTCVSCAEGKYAVSGDTACTTCPPASFSAASASYCSTCAAGSYLAPGTTICASCNPGQYCPQNSTQAIPCPDKFFCPTTSEKRECQPCPGNGLYNKGCGGTSSGTCSACS
jgi:hypothetical protein